MSTPTGKWAGWLLLLSLPLLASNAFSEEPGHFSGWIALDSTKTEYPLPHSYIDPNSFLAITDDGDTLRYGEDIQLDPTRGILGNLFSIRADSILVRYFYLPVTVPDTLQTRSPQNTVYADSLLADERAVLLPEKNPLSDPYGSGSSRLVRSGSILRGVEVGSGRDVSIESGLHLALEGEIARDIRVRALLDDRNLPVQADGSSRRLDEIDQVYVDIDAGEVKGRFGDYQLSLEGGRYGSLNRRLEGARVSWKSGNVSSTAAGAVTRAVFHTNTFNGRDGVQGPYALTGRDGERDILVVGGSESVWLNGNQLVRGENGDYIIDYSLGEITFMPRVLIDSESRIEVDFEYSPEAYPRNLYLGSFSWSSNSGQIKAKVSAMQEGDDEQHPVNFDLTKITRSLLSAAGDGSSTAQISAADSLGPGRGDYVRSDTLWTDGNNYRIFLYSQPDTDGDPTGTWSVGFSEVASGSYDRQYDTASGSYRFDWVGPGHGSYDPVLVVPLPERLRHVATSLSISPNSWLRFESDVGLSDYDANVLSSEGDDDNLGLAQDYRMNLLPLGGSTGTAPVEVAIEFRDEGARYAEPSRSNQIEYARYWGLDSTLTSTTEREQSATLLLRPHAGVSLDGSFKTLQLGENTRSDRYGANAQTQIGKWNTTVSAENIHSENDSLRERSDWLRGNISSGVRLGIWQPSIAVESEERDAVSRGEWIGYRYTRMKGDWRLIDYLGHSGELFLLGSQRDQQTDADTYDQLWSERGLGGSWNWRPRGVPIRSELELSYRLKEWSVADSSDVATRLARISSSWNPWSGALSTNMNYRLTRTVSRTNALIAYTVADGEGDYVREGDEYVYDPEIGNIILRTEPTGEAVPTTELVTALNLDWSPHRLPGGAGVIDGFGWEDISLVTQLEATEVTRWDDPTSIALFDLNTFQTDSTVSGKMLWRQDVHLFRPSRIFNLRIRYEADVQLSNLYGTGSERHASDLWDLRARNRLSELFDLESQGAWERRGKQLERRTSDDHFDLLALAEELSWRASGSWTIRAKVRGRIDRDLGNDIVARVYGLGPGLTYAIRNRGRISLDGEALWVQTGAVTLPYELAEGRAPGQNGRVSMRADIRIGQNMTARSVYTLRMDADREPIHIARVEANAFF